MFIGSNHFKWIPGILVLILILVLGTKLAYRHFRTVSTESLSTSILREQALTSPVSAQGLLIKGNERFVSGHLEIKVLGKEKRLTLANEQHPFAVVLSCSDSRVPPEILFDQGLGDLFVIRVAGNIVTEEALGSIEYAVEHLGAPLIVVLGHEQCGAVMATIDNIKSTENLTAIMAKIRPSVHKAQALGLQGNNLLQKAEDFNIAEMVNEIEQSRHIKESIQKGGVAVLGAKYHLSTGRVEWFNSL